MRTGLIACAMLRDELEHALRETGCQYQPYWLDRGLHNSPQRLREAVQAAAEQLAPAVDVILLAYGLCGGAMDGLRSPGPQMILPLYHDCIQMLLSGADPKNDKRADSLYFTRGWEQDDEFIGHTYQRACQKYGAAKAIRLYQRMLRGYRTAYVVDTGCFDVEAASRALSPTACALGLDIQVTQGSNRILKQLLTGPWDEHFYILEPGETLTTTQFLDQALLCRP